MKQKDFEELEALAKRLGANILVRMHGPANQEEPLLLYRGEAGMLIREDIAGEDYRDAVFFAAMNNRVAVMEHREDR